MWPHKVIINEVVQNSCRLEFGSQPTSDAGVKEFLKGFKGDIDFMPNIPKIALEENNFQDFVASWEHFKMTNSDVYDQLVIGCKAGINSRVRQSD